MSVCDEANRNLGGPEKELLLFHQQVGHLNFAWLQGLGRSPKNPDDVSGRKRFKFASTTTCSVRCAACEMSKAHIRSRPGSDGRKSAGQGRKPPNLLTEQLASIQKGVQSAGDLVFMDQWHSPLKGRRKETYGKEKDDDKFSGGKRFVDSATQYMFAVPQISLGVDDTVLARKSFEAHAALHGNFIKGYHADNNPFVKRSFKESLLPTQTIRLSGVGAKHQNGAAENAVRTVSSMARTMMLHAALHWPEAADLALWPFAMDYAVWLWNHMPHLQNRLAPVELFTGGKLPNDLLHLDRCHVWGCPSYVLDPVLQDNKKLPK